MSFQRFAISRDLAVDDIEGFGENADLGRDLRTMLFEQGHTVCGSAVTGGPQRRVAHHAGQRHAGRLQARHEFEPAEDLRIVAAPATPVAPLRRDQADILVIAQRIDR